MRKYSERIAQLCISCDVILDPIGIKFLEVGKLGASFRLIKNCFPLSRDVSLLKIMLDDDVVVASQTSL